MFREIIKINDRGADIRLGEVPRNLNLMGLHVVLESGQDKVISEIDSVNEGVCYTHFIGEIREGKFYNGVINKPDVNANMRLMNPDEILLITGVPGNGTFSFGVSPFYDNQRVYIDINNFFSNHLTILGNSGSGKSYGTARIMQSIFTTKDFLPYKASIIFFENNGEYISALDNLSKINPNYHFKVVSTNMANEYKKLSIPLWLLSVDDIALLLSAKTSNQLVLIERMIKLARIFSQSDETSVKFKNHLLAKAMLSILYSNDLPATKRNNIFGLFNTCQTKELNMEAVVQGAGYTRKFRDCFHVDANGIFTEGILITEYISSFLFVTVIRLCFCLTLIPGLNCRTVQLLKTDSNWTLLILSISR